MAKHSNRDVNQYAAEPIENNPVYQENLGDFLKNLVPEGHEEEQVSFPPYWKPAALTGFRATVLYRDDRDPNFQRYVLQSATKLDCRIGEVRDGEIVTIQPGQNFSMGVYAALPLHLYFGLEVTVACMNERPLRPDPVTNDPRSMWTFRMFLSPEVRKLLASTRQEDIKALQQAQKSAQREMYKELAKASAAQSASRGPLAL